MLHATRSVTRSLLLTAASGALLAGCQAADTDSDAITDRQAENAAALEYISPQAEAINVGFAGQDPANIARYLLASGADRVAMSPSGEFIAYISGVTGLRQMWIIPAQGGQPQQLTFGNGVTFFEWAPDSSVLLYGGDNNGDEQETYAYVSPDGSREGLVLKSAQGGFRRFGGFSGDGEQFAFASTERNGLDFDIYVASAGTQDEPKLVYEGKYGFFVEAVSQDGNLLVMSETVGEDADNLYLLDVKTGKRTTVSAPQSRANHADSNIVFSGDNKSLYFASSAGREFKALTRYDIADAKQSVLFSADADVENVTLCGPDETTLLWTTNTDGYGTLHGRNLKTGQDLAAPAIKKGDYGLSCSAQTSAVAISVGAYDTPGDIYTWDTKTGEVAQVFKSDMAGLSQDRLIAPVSLRIPARDGVTLQGLLYMPDADSAPEGKLPPVVFKVHGGPHAQALPDYDGPAQYLVDRGIAVFKTNVRGSSGFGRTYSALDDKKKRLDSVRDLVDMLDHLGAQGLVDTDNAAVLGGSYGGYAVNAVLAAYPGEFKAGVSLYGVADWVTALEVASPALKASDRIEYGDITEQKWRDFYTEQSPIRQADNINVPVLFSHGAMDPRIDIAETEIMVKTLRKNGIDAPYIRFEDEGHGWRKLPNRLFYFRREAEFLEKHLLGE